MKIADNASRSRLADKSRSKVVSRLIVTGSLAVTTGRSSRPFAASCIQAPRLEPNSPMSHAGSARASSPMVATPRASSLAAVFGPTPLILRAGSGQIRVGISASLRTVNPSGLSSSEAIFDRSLLGVTPIEQESPVAARTAFLIALATRRPRSFAAAGVSVLADAAGGRPTSVKSMYISSMPLSSTSGAIARTAALKRREYWR